MACKLLRMAKERWRCLDEATPLRLDRARVPFIDGHPLERSNQQDQDATVSEATLSSQATTFEYSSD